jgi:hypothetical protein
MVCCLTNNWRAPANDIAALQLARAVPRFVFGKLLRMISRAISGVARWLASSTRLFGARRISVAAVQFAGRRRQLVLPPPNLIVAGHAGSVVRGLTMLTIDGVADVSRSEMRRSLNGLQIRGMAA